MAEVFRDEMGAPYKILQSTFYTTGYIAMPTVAGTGVVATINIDGAYDFMLNYITATVTQAKLIVLNYAATIVIKDSRVDRDLMNAPIPLDAIGGNGRLPYPLNPPRIFTKDSTVTITLTTFVVTATDVSIVFHGNKVVPA